MKPLWLIAFAGLSNSGKTTLGLRLSEHLAYGFGSFGDVIRNEALTRGIVHPSRRQLQDIGNQQIEENLEGLCKAVVDNTQATKGKSAVIDGVRHLVAMKELQRLLPSHGFFLVYLNAPLRFARGSAGELSASHPVESDLPILRRVADLVLDTTANSDETFDVLLKQLPFLTR